MIIGATQEAGLGSHGMYHTTTSWSITRLLCSAVFASLVWRSCTAGRGGGGLDAGAAVPHASATAPAKTMASITARRTRPMLQPLWQAAARP